MTELKVFSCDRCNKEFTQSEDSVPHEVIWKPFGETTKYHLCEDCNAVLSFFFDKIKEFDKLPDKLAREPSNTDATYTGTD